MGGRLIQVSYKKESPPFEKKLSEALELCGSYVLKTD